MADKYKAVAATALTTLLTLACPVCAYADKSGFGGSQGATGGVKEVLVNTDVDSKLNVSLVISKTLAKAGGLVPELLGFAAAAAVLAIIIAVVRGIVFNSDSSNAATVSRIVRILLICALLGGMVECAKWAYDNTATNTQSAQGITKVGG